VRSNHSDDLDVFSPYAEFLHRFDGIERQFRLIRPDEKQYAEVFRCKQLQRIRLNVLEIDQDEIAAHRGFCDT
jgi:hypothetical protein